MYECLRDVVRRDRQLLIYDSHNCEARLRAALLGDSPLGRCLARGVERIERQLCTAADVVFACSEEDRGDFAGLYGVGDKVVVVPNGVDGDAIRPAGEATRAAARGALGLSDFVAVFTGSRYPPNVEAVETIVHRLAPATPGVTYLVVGRAGEALVAQGTTRLPANVRVLGAVSDAVRNQAYAAADMAINPVSSGSGTNIKMFDFLAAGLATLATEIGARGIAEAGRAFVVDELPAFPTWIERLRDDAVLRARLARAGRALAEERYRWRDISRRVGELILERTGHVVRTPRTGPYFSVVVASYERPDALRALLGALERQTFRDFEVIVVDQSPTALDAASVRSRFPFRYIRRDEPGATRARNAGVATAAGEIIAFTDDDCLPDPSWLERAHARLRDGALAGLEGAVVSDRDDAERYRIVSNTDFGGFGFMTANLFIRRDLLAQAGGFDERFEDPHFREDTDLAWRVLAHGPIPFAPEVRVVHPAHVRTLARESAAVRGRFFVHDALLFAKHPERYLKLLVAERHFEEPGFWDEFMKGMIRHQVCAPVDRLAAFTTTEQLAMMMELARAIGAGEVGLGRSASGPSA